MFDIAILLRFLRDFAEVAHHNVSGPSFFGDHPWLAAAYAAHAKAYDAVIEAMKAKGVAVDEFKIADEANKILQSDVQQADTNEKLFNVLLEGEEKLLGEIQAETGRMGVLEDTRQLLGDIAVEGLARRYQLRQRLALSAVNQPSTATERNQQP